MRILNEDSDQPIKSVLLLLTPQEARQIRNALEDLLADPDDCHVHIQDDVLRRQVTVAVYTPGNLKYFDSETIALIEGEE